jgi:hypothetical protein
MTCRIAEYTVEVSVVPGTLTANALFTEVATGDSFPQSFTGTTPAIGQNMEWIVERIHEDSSNPIDNLMEFGTIQFTNCAGSTTVTSGAIRPNQGIAVDMSSGDGIIAATTVIPNDTDVQVTWAHRKM